MHDHGWCALSRCVLCLIERGWNARQDLLVRLQENWAAFAGGGAITSQLHSKSLGFFNGMDSSRMSEPSILRGATAVAVWTVVLAEK